MDFILRYGKSVTVCYQRLRAGADASIYTAFKSICMTWRMYFPRNETLDLSWRVSGAERRQTVRIKSAQGDMKDVLQSIHPPLKQGFQDLDLRNPGFAVRSAQVICL